MKTRMLCLSFVLMAVLAGCAPVTQRPQIDPEAVRNEQRKQFSLIIEEDLKLYRRLGDMESSILAAGAPFCQANLGWYYGIYVTNLDVIKGEVWKQAWRDAIGLDYRLTIYAVPKKSPAERAGLQVGDAILMINGVKAPMGEKAVKEWQEFYDKASKAQEDIILTVQRGDDEKLITISPALICNYPLLLDPSGVINAFANGKNIIVHKGMLKFVKDDNELAAVVAHELAHNNMGHIGKQAGNRIGGAILGAIVSGLIGVNVTNSFAQMGGMLYTQEFEFEADYVGLYFAAVAGWDIKDVPNMWRRMVTEGQASPAQVVYGTTHPNTGARYVALEETIKEIEEKKAKGELLVPNFQK